MKFKNKIFNSDCLDILKKMPSCSIEAMISDPPYGIKFMGKEWDIDLPSLEIWKEILRVLKYGGFCAFTFSPRQDMQRVLYNRLVEAGFDINYSPLYWSTFQGFPKCGNFSKLADKKLKVKRKIIGKRNDGRYKYGFSEKAKKPLGYKNKDKQGMTEPNSYQAKQLDGWFSYNPKPAVEIIVCARKPSPEKSLIGNALKSITDDKYAVGGMFVGGTETGTEMGTEIPFGERDYKDYVKKQKSFSGAKSIGKTIKGKTTFLTGDIKIKDPSKSFKGYGTKIPYESESDAKHQDDIARGQASAKGGKFFGGKGKSLSSRYGANIPHGSIDSEQSRYGRFPSNLLLSGDFPEHIKKYFNLDRWAEQVIGDFMFISKPSTREKNSNIEGREVLKGNGSNTYNKKCIKCGRWLRHHKGEWAEHHKKYTCTCEEPEWEEPSGNLHPTTKSVSLFCYLTMLFSRENTLVLDPFSGSGTTGMACRLMNRKYLLIEKEKDYYEIIKKRMSGEIIRQKTLF